MTRLAIAVSLAAIPVAVSTGAVGIADLAAAADRQVAWVIVSNEAATERELNAQAARGLRFAAVTDGLPCAVAIMQTPDPAATSSASYRLVADRDLSAALPGLADEGYEPRGRVRRPGGRTHVIWERATRAREARTAEWRVVEFDNPDTMEAELAAVAQEGFRPRLLARTALRSWPGLSEKGLLILGKGTGSTARELRVLRGTKREVDDLSKQVESLGSQGWSLDVAFTSSRDGSREARRERAYFAFSRPAGGKEAGTAIRLERSSSWGLVGSGVPVAGLTYWNDFLYLFRPAERRQMWATPIRLSSLEANCAGLGFKLRLDGGREERSTIVGAVARPIQGTDDIELVVILDEKLGL